MLSDLTNALNDVLNCFECDRSERETTYTLKRAKTKFVAFCVVRNATLPLLSQRIEYARTLEPRLPFAASVVNEVLGSLNPFDHQRFAAAILQWKTSLRSLVDWIELQRPIQPEATSPVGERIQKRRPAIRPRIQPKAKSPPVEVVKPIVPESVSNSTCVEPDKAPPAPTPKPSHTDCFTTVNWYGEEYTFTTAQRAVVEQLWKAMDNNTPALADETLLTAAGSAGKNLRDVFRSNGKRHPAWDTMIVKVGRDARRLSPQNPESHIEPN